MRFFCLIFLFSTFTSAKGQSCANFFQYVQGADGDVEGLITLQPPQVPEHDVKAILTIAAQLPSRYVGDLSLYKGTQSSIDDLKSGSPLLYKLRFPITNPLPKISQILHNEIVICNGEKEISAQYLTTLTLSHKFRTNLSFNNYFNQIPQQPQTPAPTRYVQPTTKLYTQTLATTKKPEYNYQTTQSQVFSNRNKDSNYQCGSRKMPMTMATSLVINGFKAKRTDFPWLVAHYHSNHFICGGSLVSHRIVVTASHCIHNKKDAERAVTEYYSTYYLGKYDLHNLKEEGYISSDVQKFITHQNWNPQSDQYHSDIAIAVLIKSIQFSNTIRPICIWTQSTGHNDLVGVKGWIAGWGITEKGTVSNFPMFVRLPAVDDAVCLRSNPGFTEISSETTFCVGDKSGASPCQGDSGGAFVVKHGNNFYLRGIVSAALLNEEYECSRYDYSLFTDTSYFSDWINQHINQYDY